MLLSDVMFCEIQNLWCWDFACNADWCTNSSVLVSVASHLRKFSILLPSTHHIPSRQPSPVFPQKITLAIEEDLGCSPRSAYAFTDIPIGGNHTINTDLNPLTTITSIFRRIQLMVRSTPIEDPTETDSGSSYYHRRNNTFEVNLFNCKDFQCSDGSSIRPYMHWVSVCSVCFLCYGCVVDSTWGSLIVFINSLASTIALEHLTSLCFFYYCPWSSKYRCFI